MLATRKNAEGLKAKINDKNEMQRTATATDDSNTRPVG